jgi:hypothetical protein
VAIFGLGHALPVRAAAPQAAETLQVSLREPDPLARDYSQLPKDRADQAPKSSDLLANVTSRARDLVAPGEAKSPRLHGEDEAPMVKLERKQPAAPPQAAPTATSPAVDHDAARAAEPGQHDAQPASGSSDFPQPEMDNPGGNAALSGDISLNTTAWDYAPWLDRYRSRLLALWFAPPAYSMGILKEGGWAEIEVEISRSGQLLRLNMLGQEGHPSLIRAAESAVRAAAPTDALPADFPEPTLILRIRMYYPKVRPR